MMSARKKVNLLRPQPLKNEKEGLLFDILIVFNI